MRTLCTRAFAAAAVLVGGLSCGSESPVNSLGNRQSQDNGSGACIPGQQVTCWCTDGTTGSQACNDTGDGYAACSCPSGAAPVSTTPTTTDAPPPALHVPTGELPCDVRAVIDANCIDCHDNPPNFGAPMALTGASAFSQPSSDPNLSMGQMVLRRVRDDADPMPQPPYDRLTEADIAVLDAWINAGAPATACETNVAPTGPDGGVPDPVTDPSDPVVEPEPEPDPAVTCYNFLAHAPGSDAPYEVPNTPDTYMCFTFNAPWGDTPVQLTSAKSVIDNSQVIHHWITYNGGPVAEGGISACSGAHPGASFIAGWAPGGSDAEMPPDVGLAVPGTGFTLEIHYNNATGTPQVDASGVEICVTDQLRPNVAAVHWLGTENINLPSGGDAVGTCNPNNTGPVTILSSSPHMHLQGRHMKTVINRAGGGEEILIDEPFEFSSQVTYDTPTVINPGDTLTTTCTYGGPAFFGEGTNEEMCYNFVTAYPAGALSSGSIIRANGCTGL